MQDRGFTTGRVGGSSGSFSVALESIRVDLRKDLGRFGSCSGSIWEQIWDDLEVDQDLSGSWPGEIGKSLGRIWKLMRVDLGRLGSDQGR